MGQLQGLAAGALSYLLFAGIGGFVGYYFARKRTEHEVGYGRRVETAERIQDSVASVAEELVAAREYVSGTGPFDGAPAKRIDLRGPRNRSFAVLSLRFPSYIKPARF